MRNPVDYALARSYKNTAPVIQDIIFTIVVCAVSQMPFHVFAAFADYLVRGIKPEIVKKSFARTDVPAFLVLPEELDVRSPQNVIPEQRILLGIDHVSDRSTFLKDSL